MTGRHRSQFVAALLAIVCVSAPACNSDPSPTSCAELRAELVRVAKPVDVQQWNDITKLAQETTEALRLRDEIAARCD